MNTQSVEETLAQCGKARPALKPFLEAFGPLIARRRKVAEELAPKLAAAGLSFSRVPGHEPLLISELPQGLGNYVKLSAGELLPLLLEQQAIAPHRKALEAFFLDEAKDSGREELVAAVLEKLPDKLIALAEKNGLEPPVLEFASSFIVSAVLRGLAKGLEIEDFAGWSQGICPVCGQAPIIAWLGRKPPVGDNEFLAGGGGKKYLHCGMCGSDWHFLRGVCPSCGIQGQDAMQILGEEDKRHERIDWCLKCRVYLPQIDLREIASTPDMDAQALGMMHLDLAAAERDLSPLKPSFWNMF